MKIEDIEIPKTIAGKIEMITILNIGYFDENGDWVPPIIELNREEILEILGAK